MKFFVLSYTRQQGQPALISGASMMDFCLLSSSVYIPAFLNKGFDPGLDSNNALPLPQERLFTILGLVPWEMNAESQTPTTQGLAFTPCTKTLSQLFS